MNMSNSAVSKMSEMLLAQHIVICNCLKTYHFMHCHTQKVHHSQNAQNIDAFIILDALIARFLYT